MAYFVVLVGLAIGQLIAKDFTIGIVFDGDHLRRKIDGVELPGSVLLHGQEHISAGDARRNSRFDHDFRAEFSDQQVQHQAITLSITSALPGEMVDKLLG